MYYGEIVIVVGSSRTSEIGKAEKSILPRNKKHAQEFLEQPDFLCLLEHRSTLEHPGMLWNSMEQKVTIQLSFRCVLTLQ